MTFRATPADNSTVFLAQAVERQIEGGLLQGVGYALIEELVVEAVGLYALDVPISPEVVSRLSAVQT